MKKKAGPKADRHLQPRPAGHEARQGVPADIAHVVGRVHFGEDLRPFANGEADLHHLVDGRLEENEDEIPEKRKDQVYGIRGAQQDPATRPALMSVRRRSDTLREVRMCTRSMNGPDMALMIISQT